MDFIVLLCRLLANELRLRIHFAVARSPEIAVTQLADEVRVDRPKVSDHVKLLAEVRLLETRPSGRFVRVSVPTGESVSNALARGSNELLSETWRRMEGNSTRAHVWNWLGISHDPTSKKWDAVAARMVFFLTGYTHLRRLLIIRHLALHGPATQTQMSQVIRMSPNAASRQLDKLRRRGLMEQVRVDEGTAWQLVRSPGPPFQRRLHELVLSMLVGDK